MVTILDSIVIYIYNFETLIIAVDLCEGIMHHMNVMNVLNVSNNDGV